MSVLQHLGELKRRLVRVAIVAVVFIAIAIAFYVQIFEVFTDTARRLIVDADGVVAVQRITEGWVVAAKLAILVGLVAAFPYFMWELAMFFKPGLKPGERKYIFLLVPASMAMFALGAAFSWFILIPRLVEFLLRLSQPLGAPPHGLGGGSRRGQLRSIAGGVLPGRDPGAAGDGRHDV